MNWQGLSDSRDIVRSLLSHDLRVGLSAAAYYAHRRERSHESADDLPAREAERELTGSIQAHLAAARDEIDRAVFLPRSKDEYTLDSLSEAVRRTLSSIELCLGIARKLAISYPRRGEIEDFLHVLENNKRLCEVSVHLLHDTPTEPVILRAEDEARVAISALDELISSRNVAVVTVGEWTGALRLTLLSSILYQLLSNGIVHNNNALPKVGVSFWHDHIGGNGQGLRCIVSDNGPGIPTQYIERIFRPGFSTDRSLGIGLTIARHLTVNAGGRLELYENSRTGCKFLLLLPVVA